MKYRISVFLPVSNTHVVHVFDIDVARPLAWVRQHADELAVKCLPSAVGRYNALMVEPR